MESKVLPKTLSPFPIVRWVEVNGKECVRRKELMNPSLAHMSKLEEWNVMKEYGIDQYHGW